MGGSELAQEANFFIMNLQGRPSTSRPQAEFREVLGGLPCSEHDKERKCLVWFARFLMF